MKLFNDTLEQLLDRSPYEALANAVTAVMNYNGRDVTSDVIAQRWHIPLSRMRVTTYPNVCEAIANSVKINLELRLKVARNDKSIEVADATLHGAVNAGITDIDEETERLLTHKLTFKGFRNGSPNYNRFITEQRPVLREKVIEDALLRARRNLQMIQSQYEREIDGRETREWENNRHYYAEISRDLAALDIDSELSEGYEEIAKSFSLRLEAFEARYSKGIERLEQYIEHCQSLLGLNLTV